MIVRLSFEWEERAAAAGCMRQSFADERGLKNFGGRIISSERGRENHIIGCRSECAVAKVLGLPWSPSVGVLTAVDVGGKVEVRARRMPSFNRDLAFRDKDKDGLPYVLAHCHEDGRIELVGWLYGHEARQRDGPCFFQIKYVAPPYRSIDELVNLYGRQSEISAAPCNRERASASGA